MDEAEINGVPAIFQKCGRISDGIFDLFLVSMFVPPKAFLLFRGP
jgi:hypothetical protein